MECVVKSKSEPMGILKHNDDNNIIISAGSLTCVTSDVLSVTCICNTVYSLALDWNSHSDLGFCLPESYQSSRDAQCRSMYFVNTHKGKTFIFLQTNGCQDNYSDILSADEHWQYNLLFVRTVPSR